MKQTSVFAAIAVLFLAFSPAAVAQVITGSITGTVSDETGAVLPGVEVTVQNQDTGVSRTTISDDQGAYRAISLSLGPYEVRAELAGFQTIIRSGITLTVGREAVVDLTLRVGAITEQVFVTGEAPLVETTRATVADLVDEKKIRDLPLNGRDFIQLAILQAGVIQTISAPRSQIGNEGVKITIGGARTSQNSVLLDGTDVRNELAAAGSASGSSLGVETVREFQVITGVFSAEYGRFTGGVINAISKSGTNELHGSVFEFHRNSALDARNFFDPAGKPPAFKRNQFGFTLGGPIVPDKTFFFGAYEGFRERLLTTRISEVPNDFALLGLVPRSRGRCPLGSPTDPGTGLCDVGVDEAIRPYLELYPRANGADNGDGTANFIFPARNDSNEDYLMVRLDHQFSDSDSFFVRYTFDNGDRVLIPRLPDFGRDSEYRNQFTTLEWKRIISPTVINELRFGYTRTKHDVTPIDTSGAPGSLFFVPADRPNAVFGEIDVDGQIVDMGPEHNQFKTNVYNNFQFANHLIYTRGRHALKFGVDIHRIQFNFVNRARASGVFEFGGLPEFLSNLPHSFDGFANEFATIGMRQTVSGF